MSDHNWSANDASDYWAERCPRCGAFRVNDQFCLSCKYWYGGDVEWMYQEIAKKKKKKQVSV